jgi:hypothetical protein
MRGKHKIQIENGYGVGRWIVIAEVSAHWWTIFFQIILTCLINIFTLNEL